MKRLMLVDDHPIVRSGIQQIFADCPGITVDCEAADGEEALALLRTRTIDAVLLDLSLPGRSGIDVLRRMRADRAELPILIVSMHAERQYAVIVLKAGAHGFLSKNNDASEFVKATRLVLAGQKYVSDALADELANFVSSGTGPRAPHERLSVREFEIFGQIAAGSSVSAIAKLLFLSVKTVSTHRSRILEKMQLKTNSELTRYAILHALIE